MDRYYATKINENIISHKYKLGIIQDTDPRHLSKIESIILLFIHVLLLR
jgi:hypothetical protein